MINISVGPAFGAILKAKTAGMIANAASRAAIVLKKVVRMEALGISSVFGKYVP